MKYIKPIFVIILITCSCSKKTKYDAKSFPPYKAIHVFSEKISPNTNLVLSSYGINWGLPNGYQIKNGIANFTASYYLEKTQDDQITLEQARNLVIFVAETFLKDINNNSEIVPAFDTYPLTNKQLNISIRFEDENRIELGQGVASLHFWEGRIKYKGYNIEEYRHHPPAIGKHYTIHEESYQEALDIVKKQGDLIYFDSPKL